MEQKKILSCSKEKRMLIAYKLSKSSNAITNDAGRKLWEEWYPEDKEYFDNLPYKWNNCYNWISKCLAEHDSDEIQKLIMKQRIRQKRRLNMKCKHYGIDGYVIMIKSAIKDNRLAKYLLINGANRRTGDYGSLVAYLKSQNKIQNKCENIVNGDTL